MWESIEIGCGKRLWKISKLCIYLQWSVKYEISIEKETRFCAANLELQLEYGRWSAILSSYGINCILLVHNLCSVCISFLYSQIKSTKHTCKLYAHIYNLCQWHDVIIFRWQHKTCIWEGSSHGNPTAGPPGPAAVLTDSNTSQHDSRASMISPIGNRHLLFDTVNYNGAISIKKSVSDIASINNMINKVIYYYNILRIISMASDLFFLDIRFTCCLIWYLIRYMVTSMGINSFSYLLVFLLFQISHRVFDSKTFISLHYL